MDKALQDSGVIGTLLNDSIREFWSNFNPDLLKVLVSDSAAYVLKAECNLKSVCPRLQPVVPSARSAPSSGTRSLEAVSHLVFSS